ncbi:MAG TPA: ATP-binding protein [Syntrophales bacterium]|nr:ATP-binding protein [Syntrophales bacterium]HQN77553.1 ATP-binding protein [Syntrophales bacterium]HQQ26509.1 ATP-binding protein [Syntrophales bacterium]
MRGNLFYKVFATYVVIVLMAMAIVWTMGSRQIRERILTETEASLKTSAAMIALMPAGDTLLARIPELAVLAGARITLIDGDGAVLADSDAPNVEMDNHLNRPEIQEARVRGAGTATRYSRTLDVDTLYVALPIERDKKITGYVRLARPLTGIRKSIGDFSFLVFQSLLLAGALSFLIAFLFTSRLVTPIQEMELFTRKLQEGEISGTLLIHSADEVGRLARNINYMVMELQESARVANEEKNKLEAAFASMTDGVLVLDNDDRIEAMNGAFKSLLGIRRRDILGKTLIEAFRNLELQEALDRFKKTVLPVAREIGIPGENPKVLEVNLSAVQGYPGNGNKTMILFHDVTRLKKLERMRVDFVANVTHEIRTPLTAILGFIETLKEGALEEKETAIRFLDIISRHAQRLKRLVDDLLVLSDIETGEMRFHFETLSVKEVLDTLLPLVEQKASAKSIAVERAISAELPAIRADRDRLSQIFLNILDNAVKFTPEGGKLRLRVSSDGQSALTVEIGDTGIGIPKDEIPRLGERFYRVDKTRSRELGGTGLGLSIVKHLLKLHRGEMRIESQQGRGTTVTLTFPVAPADGGGEPKEERV